MTPTDDASDQKRRENLESLKRHDSIAASDSYARNANQNIVEEGIAGSLVLEPAFDKGSIQILLDAIFVEENELDNAIRFMTAKLKPVLNGDRLLESLKSIENNDGGTELPYVFSDHGDRLRAAHRNIERRRLEIRAIVESIEV